MSNILQIDEYAQDATYGSTPVEILSIGSRIIYIRRGMFRGETFDDEPFTIGYAKSLFYVEDPFEITPNDSKFNVVLPKTSALSLSTTSFAGNGKPGVKNLDNIKTITEIPNEICLQNHMFSGCRQMEYINLGEERRLCGNSLTYLFYGCAKLKSLKLPKAIILGYNFMNDMSSMFSGCESLESIDFGDNFTTAGAKTLSHMFAHCVKLPELNLTFKTSSCTDMSYMFYWCIYMETLDLGNSFDTSKVTDMSYMFSDMRTIHTLNLGNLFNMSNVTNATYMFSTCFELANVTGKITGINVNIDLYSSPLTRESALIFINGLAKVTDTKTLKFKKVTYNTLTEQDIAIGTSKGWTITRL